MALRLGRVDAHPSVQRALDAIARLFPLGRAHLKNETRGDLLTFTAATLPAASTMTGRVVYVSDGAAGAKFQGSNGSAWVNLG